MEMKSSGLGKRSTSKPNLSRQRTLFRIAPLVLEECPFCHKFLAAELLSKEEVDTAEALKEKDVLFNMGLSIETGERVADHPEGFLTYKFAYRCRDCGKEWRKFKVREVGIPTEYVEDEEERTDYEAGKEEEDAREEQYARE
jgi:hypothetical protein